MTEGSVARRVATEGAAAGLSEAAVGDAPTAGEAAALLREASSRSLDDAAELLATWSRLGAYAGGADRLEELDGLLSDGVPGGLLSGFSRRKRRLRDQARRVLAQSGSPSAVRLAAAVLGATGDSRDVAVLEPLGVHPALTLHVVTALANLGLVVRDARLALLRLMHVLHGAERVLAIDRLLAFVGEPAVRLALVRDALRGLEPGHAHEVAGAIYTACNVEQGLRDVESSPELREGARLVMLHREPPEDVDDTEDASG